MLKRHADTEGVAVLFVTCVLGTLVSAEHYGWTDQMQYFSALAFAVTGWLSVAIFEREMSRLIKSGNQALEEIRWKFLAQSVIDERLSVFATTFDEMCQTQVRLRRGVDDGDDQELSDLRVMLESAKQSFWRAHKLAQDLGFEVRPKVGDYLSNPS